MKLAAGIVRLKKKLNKTTKFTDLGVNRPNVTLTLRLVRDLLIFGTEVPVYYDYMVLVAKCTMAQTFAQSTSL